MAMKLTLTAALLVALVAFATATITTTVVTTTIDDEANPQKQQCQQQLQGRQFRSCQTYMTRRGSLYEGEVLEMSSENPRQEEPLKECCEQLWKVNPQCQCEAIRQAVRQSGGSYQGEQMQQVRQKAENLPRICNLPQAQQCKIRSIFV